MQFSSRAFDTFVAPARLRPQVWRLVLGLVVIMAIYLGFMALVGIGFSLIYGLDNVDTMLGHVGLGSEPLALVILLFTFLGLIFGTFAAVKVVHRRSVASLFGPFPLVLRDFLVGFVILSLVSLPGIIWFFFAVDLTPGINWQIWLMFLPLALIGLLVQTGAEELVFRSYMQQQLAARFASRWVWMVLPSVVFGLVHYDPTSMGDSVWALMLVTGFFGLIMADLTARSGSIGMAWGLHFANNMFAILLFTTGEALDALALYRLPFNIQDTTSILPLLGLDVLGMILVWGICCWTLRRR